MRPPADSLFETTLREELSAGHMPASEQAAVQARRLRTLLSRAAQYVPLYRTHYADCRRLLADVRGPEDLWRLPAITKKDYVQAGPRACVDEREDWARLVRNTTSGSLGPALELFATPAESVVHAAMLWSGWRGQLHDGDRLFCLAAPALQKLHQHLPSVFVSVQATAVDTRALFCAFQPTVVIGSVEAIALLATDLRAHDVAQRRQVRLAFPFGQTLTSELEAMIRAGFPADLFNLYGSNETVWIGCECERHDGLHIPMTRIVVQVARLGEPDTPAAPGESGEVIVTSLARWAMPFIRYRIGDVAALETEPCACGRQTPRLRALEGRVQDFLISTAGAWVSPGAVQTDLAYGQDSIRDHRVVQESREHVVAWIVPAAGFGAQQRQHIHRVMQSHLGAVRVDIMLVDEIPRDPSGKRRRVYRAFEAP